MEDSQQPRIIMIPAPQAPRSGLNFTEALLLLFLYCKLTHSIAWDWVWVVSPIWLSYLMNFAYGYLWKKRNTRKGEQM